MVAVHDQRRGFTVIIGFVRSGFGRVTGKTYSGTNSSGSYTYDYDANGNLWRLTDNTDSRS